MDMKKQSIQFSSNSPLGKTKTEKVLEKWATDGEIHEEDIRKAASSYAKLEINNKIMRWIILAIVVFLFILLGFMIASVVIGVQITKDVSVKNGVLVPASGNQTAVKTALMKYNTKITYFTPLAIIDSMKTISVPVQEGVYQGTFQFEVVSYIYVNGKTLVFNGHTHSLNVLGDGTAILSPLLSYDGLIFETKVTSVSGFYFTNATSQVIVISTCDQLNSLSDPNGNYQLAKSLTCTLQNKLFSGNSFTGVFDGNGNNLTVTYNGGTGTAALFDSISGTIQNLVLNGQISGEGNCGGFAVTAVSGFLFSKCASNVQITCQTSAGTTYVGGFASVFAASKFTATPATSSFYNSVSQGQFTLSGTGAAQIGAYYGESFGLPVQFELCLVDSAIAPIVNSNSQVFAIIGFDNSVANTNPNGAISCIVTNNIASSPYQAYCPKIERCPNFPPFTQNPINLQIQNCNANFCYLCRDTTFNRSAVFAQTYPVYPNFFDPQLCVSN